MQSQQQHMTVLMLNTLRKLDGNNNGLGEGGIYSNAPPVILTAAVGTKQTVLIIGD